MIINETHKDFAKYYLEALEVEHFKTAQLTSKIPDMGNIYIVDGEVMCLAVTYKVEQQDDITWWICVWACKRKHTKQLIEISKEYLNRHPKNSVLLSHVQTKHVYNHAVYRASLYLAKIIGFRLIDYSEYCDIIEYRT